MEVNQVVPPNPFDLVQVLTLKAGALDDVAKSIGRKPTRGNLARAEGLIARLGSLVRALKAFEEAHRAR